MTFDCCTLPADDEISIRPFELAPVGSRRFTKSPGDFIHRGIITLSRDCVVSAPLPGLSPCCSDSPPSHGEGTFLSRSTMNANLPSVIRLLLAIGYYAIAPTKAFPHPKKDIYITRVGEKTFFTVTWPVAESREAERPRSPSTSSATILIGNSLRAFRTSSTLNLPMFAN